MLMFDIDEIPVSNQSTGRDSGHSYPIFPNPRWEILLSTSRLSNLLPNSG